MSWDYNTSKDRIQRHLDSMGPINIEKLVRDADLETLLSETECREIFGAHVYVNVPNFAQLASEVDGEDYKRSLQAIHLYQREVTRIVEQTFAGVRIHFQGPKLHALFYRPIDDAEALATKAALLQLVLRKFVTAVFNPAFPRVNNLAVAGGADMGSAIGTQDGQRGDRELLFVGAPANYAAKIIRGNEFLVTAALHEHLPKEVTDAADESTDGNYALALLSDDDLSAFLDTAGIEWDPQDSADALEDDKRLFPLKDIAYGDADVAIDFDSLSIRNNKRVNGASVFADVAGFTKYVDEAQTKEEKKAALRVLHAIRKEMAAVVKNDFGAVRVQYQGDRVQGLIHLPKDDAEAIVEKAVKTAAALQSSMEQTIKSCLPEATDLHLAVGVDYGVTLASKLGMRADRDCICIGVPVERAAEAQEHCDGMETAITTHCFPLLPEYLQKQFTKDDERGLYVATGLTADRIERSAKAAAYSAGAVFVRSSAAGVTVGQRETSSARQILPSKSWAK